MDKPCEYIGAATSRVFKTVDLEDKSCGELELMVKTTVQKINQTNAQGAAGPAIRALESELAANRERYEHQCGRMVPVAIPHVQKEPAAETQIAAAANPPHPEVQAPPPPRPQKEDTLVQKLLRKAGVSGGSSAGDSSKEAYEPEAMYGEVKGAPNPNSGTSIVLRFLYAAVPIGAIVAFLVRRSRRRARQQDDLTTTDSDMKTPSPADETETDDSSSDSSADMASEGRHL
jgi:hypothetical protein